MELTKTKWFRISVGIILFLTIIWLINEVQFIFTPLVVFFQTLFAPFLLGGILFYLFRPFIRLLERMKVPRKIGIILLYLIFVGFLTFIISVIAPVVHQQFSNLIDNIPEMVDVVEQGITYWQTNQDLLPQYAKNAIDYVSNRLEDILMSTGTYLGEVLGNVVGFIVSLVIVPFILFYLLSDQEKFVPNVTRYFSKSQAHQIKEVFRDMDKAIASYIQGQLIVSSFVGIVLFIGYLIIGLDYSLLLALFGMVTNVIPFLGPFIAAIPAVIAGWFQDPMMSVYVIIVMVVAQQAESNLISPLVMGKSLNVHPLTIILLVLVGGNLAGVLGMILIIPFYAVGKVIVQHIYRLWNIHKQTKDKQA
ncbi:Predicted PurR-regulated permease PerM [Salinibacillus kushneri]|uniref:Predicted PurR-regulated permease PerM n=1 Tax=Salinibacillus kushneri TaxID=237682 RepID=A0A1I0I9A8_9BACI|nr:AI-2E family transporter [Salinibacillus kushneri]SET93165.1 Predicted PurR-regulated permease PerM [Salinibacillus kushneri]